MLLVYLLFSMRLYLKREEAMSAKCRWFLLMGAMAFSTLALAEEKYVTVEEEVGRVSGQSPGAVYETQTISCSEVKRRAGMYRSIVLGGRSPDHWAMKKKMDQYEHLYAWECK